MKKVKFWSHYLKELQVDTFVDGIVYKVMVILSINVGHILR